YHNPRLVASRRSTKDRSDDSDTVRPDAARRSLAEKARRRCKARPAPTEARRVMTLILFQTIVQSVTSTLHWIGFSIGVRSLPGDKARQRLWIIGSAVVFAAWLFGVMLPAADDFFHNDVLPPRIPAALLVTLAVGYLFLLSRTFRDIITAIPQ